MKVNVWVLSTTVPGDSDPCWPYVYGSQADADKGFAEMMQREWETNQPEDEETSEKLPFPDDPNEAHEVLKTYRGPEWGRWMITKNEVEVPDLEVTVTVDSGSVTNVVTPDGVKVIVKDYDVEDDADHLRDENGPYVRDEWGVA